MVCEGIKCIALAKFTYRQPTETPSLVIWFEFEYVKSHQNQQPYNSVEVYHEVISFYRHFRKYHKTSILKHFSLKGLYSNARVYETKHAVLSYPLHMFQMCPELYQFHLFDMPLQVLPPLTQVCQLALEVVAGFHHPVLDPLCPETHVSPSKFYLLFGENTSSGNFLRKVAWTIKALKPMEPENVISSFSQFDICPLGCITLLETYFPSSFLKSLAVSGLLNVKISLAVYSKLKSYFSY